jgi:N-acetylneuraminic acid mutarotase
MCSYKFLYIIFISFWLVNSVYAQPKGEWTELPPIPSKRTEVAVTLLDKRIYVVGGFTQNGITDRVEVWEAEKKNWSQLPSLPIPLHHTTVSVVNGKLYVIGGFTSKLWTPFNTNYEYDPLKNKWSVKASMPTKRGALAAAEIDGKIYIVGGANKIKNSLTNSPALEVYDPKNDTWKKLAPLTTPRDHMAASSLNGKIYVIGGRIDVDFRNNLDTNEEYDPETNHWFSRSPLKTKRSGVTSQVLNNKILVFGGKSRQGTFTENEAYDPNTDTWETLSPMPSGRHGL